MRIADEIWDARHRLRLARLPLLACPALLLACAALAPAQQTQQPQQTPEAGQQQTTPQQTGKASTTPDQGPNRPPSNTSLLAVPPAQNTHFDAANTARQKQLAADSAQLLKLATELKAEVDKTTKDTLSLTVIRKAGQIEKLAHDVKEKMKQTTGSN